MASRVEIQERIDIMQAWVDGGEVEYFHDHTNSWRNLSNTFISFDFERWNYRIKPKPREIWVPVVKTGERMHPSWFSSKEDAIASHCHCVDAVKYREVLDDE